MAAILTGLEERDVLFVDEIHRLNRAIEELLYPAMEDGCIDIVLGQGPGAQSIRLELRPFTLVGATTRTGLLTTPLRDRFGIPHRLDHYTQAEVEEAVRRSARILGVELDEGGRAEIARRSRGAPRGAPRLPRRRRAPPPARAARRGPPPASSGASATPRRCAPPARSPTRSRARRWRSSR